MRKRSYIGAILFVLIIGFESSVHPGIKTVGTPLIRHYERSDFQAGRQTWMIRQGENGMMYFANNDGLLEYDGAGWNVYQLPNRTIIRCIQPDGDGRIYAGGFNEFGYFQAQEQGRLGYHSLRDLLPVDKRDFGEVWKIHLTPFGVVFQSFSSIMIVKEGSVEIIDAPSQFHFSFFINGELYIFDWKEGLLRLALGKLFPVVGTESLSGKEVWAMLPLEEGILIATAGHGTFFYDGSHLEEWGGSTSTLLSEEKVFCAALLGQDVIAFGTIQKGLVITDLAGNILQEISRDEGLQNNTILSMNPDSHGNLWLGLDNGIDYLEINSPLSLMSRQYGLNSGYAAVIHKDILYLGTNQGVFATSWDSISKPNKPLNLFRAVANTSGQVWVLQVIDGKLFCGHNNGTYLIEGYQATRINDITGGWKYLPLDGRQDKILAGTYSGFILFEKQNGEWKFKNRIKGFEESSRDFFQDDSGNIWMGHGLKGIYRLRINEQLDSVNSVDFYHGTAGLTSEFGMTLFTFRDSVYVTTEQGIYRFDPGINAFTRSSVMRSILGDFFYRKIILDRVGNIWYFLGSNAGVYRLQEDGTYLDISLPFEQISGSFIGGFEYVYPFDEQNVFFGTENGFVHYNPSFKKEYNNPLTAYIRQLSISTADSLLFNGQTDRYYKLETLIPFRDNSLQFFFSANDFENPVRVEYSSFLEGLDESWTAWGSQGNREFTNLREGEYVFSVKARNIYRVESEPVSISFRIQPPWQRSLLAFGIYGLLFLVFAFLGLVAVRRKIMRSRLKAEHLKEQQFKQREKELERASLEAEKELIRMRNEKLKEEMVLKDKELANSTLQMIQKNKLLVTLKEELKNLSQVSKDGEVKSQVRSLTKKINRDIDIDSQWKVFETQFEKVHEEFLQRIKARFPALTPRELKLCAYLRLNISSKEIALLMNISTRGVEISRYRLRKKLNLDRDTNLTDFIMNF